MWYKRKLVIFIYNSYIDGLSTEEIYFKLRIVYKMEKLNFDEINSIIDDVNLIL
jgi:hypothetical protein